MKKLKIAVLGTRGFPNVQGGVEAHCENLYPRLAGNGCEIMVFTRKPYVDISVGSYQNVRLIPLPCPKSKFFETFLHTFIGIFAAMRYSPDILHIHAIGPSLFVPLARLLGFKVVMTSHGPDYQREKWGRLAKIILRLGERLGSSWANQVICISEHVAGGIRRRYHREVTVIPNGVAPHDIVQTDVALRRYGLEKGRYFLAVGRFVPEKGFHDLIDAFNLFQTLNARHCATLSEQTPADWKLVIVGRADHEDRYSLDLREMAGKNNRIVLTGFLKGEPLQELYSHAGLFVIPSYYEGLPIVLLEALSYGLSCIASDIPANRNVELPEDRFFQAGDKKVLAEKLLEFAGKPLTENERRQLAQMIAERYNWDKIAEKTRDVYEKAFVRM